MEGSRWFKKFKKDVEKMSPHFEFRRIKYGFYRIYWTGGGEPAYVHEVYKWMPVKGYDYEDWDPRFESHRYYQEYEDQAELTMKVKNFVEGYWDSLQTMKKRLRMFKNDKEFRKEAIEAYRNVRVK
jgi:hypothetical protein